MSMRNLFLVNFSNIQHDTFLMHRVTCQKVRFIQRKENILIKTLMKTISIDIYRSYHSNYEHFIQRETIYVI